MVGLAVSGFRTLFPRCAGTSFPGVAGHRSRLRQRTRTKRSSTRSPKPVCPSTRQHSDSRSQPAGSECCSGATTTAVSPHSLPGPDAHTPTPPPPAKRPARGLSHCAMNSPALAWTREQSPSTTASPARTSPRCQRSGGSSRAKARSGPSPRNGHALPGDVSRPRSQTRPGNPTSPTGHLPMGQSRGGSHRRDHRRTPHRPRHELPEETQPTTRSMTRHTRPTIGTMTRHTPTPETTKCRDTE